MLLDRLLRDVPENTDPLVGLDEFRSNEVVPLTTLREFMFYVLRIQGFA